MAPFRFDRDTFAFANELVWEYRRDPATGRVTPFRNPSRPAYTHRCFVMARSARQFFYHARFGPGLPPADAVRYDALIREVVSRSARVRSPDAARVVIPGFEGLRAFSRANERLLKAGCGGAWQSYVLRSHWRMVFPVRRRHQEDVAARLRVRVRDGAAPIVHLFRFPRITINHGIVLYDLAETDRELRFEAYDPNVPAEPARLVYDIGRRTFWFPAACYFAGGPVNVIEVYRGGFY